MTPLRAQGAVRLCPGLRQAQALGNSDASSGCKMAWMAGPGAAGRKKTDVRRCRIAHVDRPPYEAAAAAVSPSLLQGRTAYHTVRRRARVPHRPGTCVRRASPARGQARIPFVEGAGCVASPATRPLECARVSPSARCARAVMSCRPLALFDALRPRAVGRPRAGCPQSSNHPGRCG